MVQMEIFYELNQNRSNGWGNGLSYVENPVFADWTSSSSLREFFNYQEKREIRKCYMYVVYKLLV